MFTSRPGTMRGPPVKTPLPLLLLLLLLLSPLLTTVSCQYENVENEEDAEGNVEDGLQGYDVGTDDEDTGGTEAPSDPDASSLVQPTSFPFTTLSLIEVTEELGSGEDTRSFSDDGSSPPPDGTGQPPAELDEGLGLIIIIIPVVLVIVIIAVICGIFTHRRLNQKVRNPDVHTEDPYLEGSSTEKVPMPMFEEDVPSVLEVEMDELDQWMKKDVDTADDS